MMKCIFIVGFDKLIKKGFILNRIPKISEITDYASKIYLTYKIKYNQEEDYKKNQMI